MIFWWNILTYITEASFQFWFWDTCHYICGVERFAYPFEIAFTNPWFHWYLKFDSVIIGWGWYDWSPLFVLLYSFFSWNINGFAWLLGCWLSRFTTCEYLFRWAAFTFSILLKKLINNWKFRNLFKFYFIKDEN